MFEIFKMGRAVNKDQKDIFAATLFNQLKSKIYEENFTARHAINS